MGVGPPMRIHWYWPHPHRESHPVVEGVMRPGDELVVQAFSSYAGQPLAGNHTYSVVRDLPDPAPPAQWRVLLRPWRAIERCTRRRRMSKGFDVVHIETLTYEVDAFDLPRLARRVPVVAVVHDVEPHVARLPIAIQAWLHRRVYRSDVDFVVFHPTLALELTDRYGVDPARIHSLPLPLTGDRFLACPGRPPMVLFFGSLRANKGVDVLCEAIRVLDLPGVRFVVAGRGDPDIEKRLTDLAARDPRLELDLATIDTDRKLRLFAEASCIVLPYTSFHSQSGVLADAYAARRPLVVSDVGALGPTVRADGTGLVVAPGDATALAAAITSVIGRGVDSYGVFLEAAATRHDPHAVGDALREVYEVASRRKVSS